MDAKAKAREAMIAKRFGGNANGAKGAGGKVMKAVKKGAGIGTDNRLGSVLKKLQMQDMKTLEECNMFKSDGTVIHIPQPKVMASYGSNTYQITGRAENKNVTEMLPNILNQLGPESMDRLREYAAQMDAANSGKADDDADDSDDDEVPELVENFEDAADDDDDVPDLVDQTD